MLYGCLFSQSLVFATNEETQPAQVMVDIYDPPIPFAALDRFYLTYELYLTNFYNTDITLDAIQIHDKDTDTPLLGFDKNALRKMIRNTCADSAPCDSLVIPPGGMKLVYLLLPFNSQNDLPKDIIQRVFITKKDDNTQAELKTLPLKVNKAMTVMVRPPVRGDYWVAMNGLAAISPNRVAHMVLNGQNYFAQRYAIDFMQLDLDGKTFQGNEHDNASYYAYGKDVLAVARGTVVAIKNGIPDNKPQLTEKETQKLGKFNLDNMAGNYVVLELSKGIFAFYANLKPDSIKVKVGGKVTEGQVLGQIGNSGQSQLPHLHFQVVDRPSYLAGNGVPYTFTEFWVRPSDIVENGTEKMFKYTETPDGLKRYNNQALLENTVVKFDEEGRNSKEKRSGFASNIDDDDDDEDVPAKVKANPSNSYRNSSANSSVITEDSYRPTARTESNNPNFNMQRQPQNTRPGVSQNPRARTNRTDTQKTRSSRDPLTQGLRKLFGVE